MDRELVVWKRDSFHITFGFVLNILITLTTIVIAFASLRNDTFNALQAIEKQEKIIGEQQRTIIDIRMTMQKISDDQDYFHRQYNEDMNKYIRERPTK